MKSTVSVGLGLVVSCVLAFAGCGDDDSTPASGQGGSAGAPHGGASHAHGGASGLTLECQVIGELCHEADTGSGPGHECHETGHEGRADACTKEFDDCVAVCTAVDEPAGGAGPSKDSRCAALGELCHRVDDVDGPLHACHELGHVNDAAECAAEFDDCASQCLEAIEELEAEAGAGDANGAGAGGVSSAAGTSGLSGAAPGGAGGAR